MDKHDRLMHDILKKTEDDILRWSVVGPNDLGGIIPVVHGVRRIVCSTYPLGKRAYKLYFVESKVRRFGDFGAISEASQFELFVVNAENQVALILVDGLVERNDLLRLAGLIDEHNDQAREFFEEFDRSGAA